MIDEKILIEKIRNNSKKVGDGISNLIFKGGYQLAHADIIEIIHSTQGERTDTVGNKKNS